jgi:hypothetical protein
VEPLGAVDLDDAVRDDRRELRTKKLLGLGRQIADWLRGRIPHKYNNRTKREMRRVQRER